MINSRTVTNVKLLPYLFLGLLFIGCSSFQKQELGDAPFQKGRILLIHSGASEQAVKARFAWFESYENGKRTVAIEIFDIWGNKLFETLKGINPSDGMSSDWYFFLHDGKIIDNTMITTEIFRLLKIQFTQRSLFELLDDISALINESRKHTKKRIAHQMKKKSAHSEIIVKIIFD